VQPSARAPVNIAASAVFGEGCTFGYPKEARLTGGHPGEACAPVVIGERCLIFNQVIVYEGVRIGDDCVLEDRVRLGYDVRVGDRSRLVYGGYICDRVSIGSDTRVGGFVCDGVIIGDRSTVMGQLVHEYTRPHEPWWEVDEAPPVIGEDTVVAYGALVVGGIRIGPRSYVAAGAVITKDVPPEHVATGTNILTPMDQWSGERLQGLIRSLQQPRPAGGTNPGGHDVAST
jgi:acetyltransferase-like isoleucine patch superfamily enzyme